MGLASVARGLGTEARLQARADSGAAIGICRRTGIGRVRRLDVGQLWVQERPGRRYRRMSSRRRSARSSSTGARSSCTSTGKGAAPRRRRRWTAGLGGGAGSPQTLREREPRDPVCLRRCGPRGAGVADDPFRLPPRPPVPFGDVEVGGLPTAAAPVYVPPPVL
eukprot:2856129-Alexandrium_andersonii.AAC.1